MSDRSQPMPSVARRVIVRNTVLNLAGQVAPLVAALIAVPGLLAALGIERFGVLTLAWVIVGYFSLFDFGIGRALTKLVAERPLARDHDSVVTLVWTALVLLSGIGVIIAAALALSAEWLASTALTISPELQDEAIATFYVLAATVPFVISTAALRGVLEAQHRFGAVNAIRIPLGIVTFAGPLLAVGFTQHLAVVVAVLAVIRIFAWGAHVALCAAVLPRTGGFSVRRQDARALFALGTWMTVSNIVGPLMTYLDRFLIGAMVSLAAVAYYSTPYEIVTKFWVLPAALAGVLFPAFASQVRANPDEAGRLLTLGTKWTFLLVFPAAFLLIIFAYDGLDLWLGAEFAGQSSRVMQVLVIGVLINCVAQIPFAFLQAAGRPDLTAKLHLLELPVYLGGVYWLIAEYGILGAAVAWVLRVGFDLAALLVLTRPWITGAGAMRNLIVALLIALGLLFIGMFLSSLAIKIAYAAIVGAGLAALTWRVILTGGEKAMLRHPGALLDRDIRFPS